MSKSILIIASHPDDETIGCGASIAKHSENGDTVKVLTLTNGVSSRREVGVKESEARIKAYHKALSILGAESIMEGSFPDNQLDSVPLLELVQFVESVKSKYKFDIIYTHSSSDLNIDHRKAFEATITAFRPEPEEESNEIRCFEILSSTDFSFGQINSIFEPNLFIDITKFYKKKVEALKCYEDEMRNFPHSRSFEALEALAKLRGSSVGVKKAEAFEIIRKIVR